MKEYNIAYGLGIMRSKTDGRYYGFRTVDLVSSTIPANPFDTFTPIPDGVNVTQASVRCVNRNNSTIYSSSGNNEVYAYKVGLGTQEKILTLASDERVVYMEDIRYPDSPSFAHLVVITVRGDSWNMYCYDYLGSSDELASTVPVKTYSGTGKAVHVLYRGAVGIPSF
jgi:hypothetical protein